jgi:hypothetical protein
VGLSRDRVLVASSQFALPGFHSVLKMTVVLFWEHEILVLKKVLVPEFSPDCRTVWAFLLPNIPTDPGYIPCQDRQTERERERERGREGVWGLESASVFTFHQNMKLSSFIEVGRRYLSLESRYGKEFHTSRLKQGFSTSGTLAIHGLCRSTG